MSDVLTPFKPGSRSRWRRIGLIAGIILLVILVALGAFALTFTEKTLDTPPVDVGPLPPASPPKDMSISNIDTGTYDTPAMFAFRGGRLRDVRQFAASAILIRHPKGNLLIDTGFGRKIDDQMKLLPSMQQSSHHKKRTVIDTLTSAGRSSHFITGVIPTHAHWDHISGVADLPGIPVFENASGEAWIKSKGEGTEVVNSFPNVNFRQYQFEGGPYLGFARSHDVWGDGSVVIVPAPGHTPDSVIVFVNLPSGKRYAFLGDLVWQMEGLSIPTEKPWMLRWLIGENREETNTDIARIRAATSRYPQIQAVPAHETRAFASIPSFPQSQN